MRRVIELPLTRREREVLDLIAEGHVDAAMGRKLGLAEATITSHVKTAMRKLGAATRSHAVALHLRDKHADELFRVRHGVA